MDQHQTTTIVLFRDDLRVSDHEALFRAAERGPVIPLFVWDEESYGEWPLGGAAVFWLKGALHRLHSELKALGSSLVMRRGNTCEELTAIHGLHNFHSVHVSRDVSPAGQRLETQLKTWCKKQKIEFSSFGGSTLIDPSDLKNRSGSYYKVFTPFWQAVREQISELPHYQVANLDAVPNQIQSTITYSDVDPADGMAWQQPLHQYWQSQPQTAKAMLEDFSDKLTRYSSQRDFPAIDATSSLSPFLRFGEISPHTIWRKLNHEAGPTADAFLRQIAWRDFAHHMLWHRPDMPSKPLQPKFEDYPWSHTKDSRFRAWTQGRTGVPLVDAGMRQLWQTGIMHNRVRMIVASYLVKNLHISWQLGQEWFWDTLVDADLANNAFGWQWVAGCGADAAPFFRIFNPLTQATKFDPEELYRKKWLPSSYNSTPLVDLAQERKRALQFYSEIKGATATS